MGLDQFNVAPDNKGGRKKKDKTEEQKRRNGDYEEAYTTAHGEEFISEVWDEYYEDGRDIQEVLADVSHHTSCLPRTICHLLDQHGVYNIRNHTESNKQIEEYFSNNTPTSGPSETNTEEDVEEDEPSSGLASLVNNAK